MRIHLAAIAGSFLLASSAFAMGPLDADGDGTLTEAEFEPIAAMGASFTAYDSDGDGVLSKPEYNDGVIALADRDGTGGSNDLDGEELKMADELQAMFSNEVDDDSILSFFNQ